MRNQILLLFLLLPFLSYSQCAECAINPQCTANPERPTLCPSELPNGIAGETYDTDITFFMPRQFTDEGSGINVTLASITILSVSGLPEGMSWTANEPDNIYDITQDPTSQRGCVKFCGTPLNIGSYVVSVNVIAGISAPIATQSAQSFSVPLFIGPGGAGNAGFSFSPSFGCDSLSVAFEALITSQLQPVTYQWDFGNGNTSNEQFPQSQFYANPNTYYISLQTDLLRYIITAVSFTSTGNAWCGDVEEPSLPFVGCTGAPDIYYVLSNGSSGQGATIDNSTIYSQTGLSHSITEQTFSISFFDEDLISQDDALGSANITFDGPGNYPFTASGGFGSITIETQVASSLTFNDSVIVHPPPATPEILPAFSALCEGDSISLQTGVYASYQWFLNGVTLTNETQNNLIANEQGNYKVEVKSAVGCRSVSDSVTVSVEEYPSIPVIFSNPVSGKLLCNPGNGLDWVWLFEGDTLSETLNQPSIEPQETGNYTVSTTNSTGCTSVSEAMYFTNVGWKEINSSVELKLYPQPWASGNLTCELPGNYNGKITVQWFDLSGKLITELDEVVKSGQLLLHPQRLPLGITILKLTTSEFTYTQRVFLFE